MLEIKGILVSAMLILCLGYVGSQTLDDKAFCDLFDPDEMVDDLMKGVAQELPSPMALPNIDWIINLHHGQVSKMNTLVRVAKVNNTCTKESMNLRVSLRNKQVIKGFFLWTKPIWLTGGSLNGKAHTWLRRMDMKLDIRVPFDGKPPGIKALDVDAFKGLSVRIDGLGSFSGQASMLATQLANRFTHQIVTIVERAIAQIFTRDFLNRVLSH